MESRLSTGCHSLDEILGGGFDYGRVSLIYGEASTGKTTLVLSSIISHLRGNPSLKAIYIDADQGLSINRLMQIAGTDGKQLLERLLIWSPKTFSEQSEIVEGLLTLRSGEATTVVVDSITSLYRLEVGDAERTFSINKALNRQLGFLSETAKTKATAVLLTGQVHSILGSTPPQIEPVARRLLQFWSDLILKLENTHLPSIRQAMLEKPENRQKACRFGLGDTGLKDYERTW